MVRETTIAMSQQKQHESNQPPYILLIGDLTANATPTQGLGQLKQSLSNPLAGMPYTLGGEGDTGAYH